MNKKENIRDFHIRHGREHPKAGLFNVYNREEFSCDSTSLPPNRRDFYKISMITRGTGILSYADKVIKIDKPSITFFNPLIPYSWEPTSKDKAGYFCLFTEDFINQSLKSESLSHSPLFKIGGNHLFFPTVESIELLKGVFENMFLEIRSQYVHKYELLRSYVQIIMHEAMKINPADAFYQPVNSADRITTMFLELLELQFPIDSPTQTLKLKTAKEFAMQLNLHTNTLNRVLKESTGKTTTEWISNRIANEAKAILQFSNWDIAEIAYSLGFEYSANFIIFFKKHTNTTPLQYRKTICTAISKL